MRRLLLLTAWLPLSAQSLYAQSVVPPWSIPEVVPRFEPRWDDNPLACSVRPFGPTLDFGFRIEAGYMVQLPLRQFEGPGHWILIITRVTPEGGDRNPVYLGVRLRFPKVPVNRAEIELGGGYLVGEGRYDVNWMMLDDQGRVCRKFWHIEAKLQHNERKAKVVMRPNTVTAFSVVGTRSTEQVRDDRAPIRVTILLHAAPLSSRRTHFRASDRMMLLGTVSALLERLPTKSVRLVVFNLDQQRELYRKEDFARAELAQVQQSLNQVELDTVDFGVLQHPKGHVDLLEDLVNQELKSERPSDAVIFMGPSTRYFDKIPRDSIERPASIPRFFYFQYRPFVRRAAPWMPDSINFTISSLKGKSLVIRTPGDFARAIDQLERSVGPGGPNEPAGIGGKK